MHQAWPPPWRHSGSICQQLALLPQEGKEDETSVCESKEWQLARDRLLCVRCLIDLFYCCSFLGESDLRNTAAEDGALLDDADSDSVDFSEDESDHELAHAGKYFRFFTESDDLKFVLFVEIGIKRVISVQTVNDYSEIELSISIPPPPDSLFHASGFPHASQLMNVESIEESFVIVPERSLMRKKETTEFWPNAETPLYAVFSWMFAPTEPEIEPTKVEKDLSNIFFRKSK